MNDLGSYVAYCLQLDICKIKIDVTDGWHADKLILVARSFDIHKLDLPRVLYEPS